MTSSYTSSNRILKQGAGDNVNTWGALQSSGDFDMIDQALDGFVSIALTGNVSLTTQNALSDQARNRMLQFTGTGPFSATLPPVSKFYLVWNAMTGILTVTNGTASVALLPGEVVGIVTDGGANIGRVQPTDFGNKRITSVGAPTTGSDACTKAYADALAFSSQSGNLPGQVAGGVLITNGATPSWLTGTAGQFLASSGGALSFAYAVTQGGGLASVSNNLLTVPIAGAADYQGGSDNTKALTSGGVYSAAAEVALTYASTIAVDMSTFLNAAVTLTGNAVLGNPTNLKVGQEGAIRLVQDATGGRVLSFGSYWKRQGGAALLSTGANVVDVLVYKVLTPTYVVYNVMVNPS